MKLKQMELLRLPFSEYRNLPDEEKERIHLQVYQQCRGWAERELAKRRAQWLVMCGGEVIKASSTLEDLPSGEELERIGEEQNLVPFLFVREPLIEESAWSPLGRGDFYPALPLMVGPQDMEVEELPLSGVEFKTDFDTGSPCLFLNYEKLLRTGFIAPQPPLLMCFGTHLGEVYRYFILPLKVGVRTINGRILGREMLTHCVKEWEESPLTRINPQREGLAGRNLLLEIPLRLELDGRNKRTKVLG